MCTNWIKEYKVFSVCRGSRKKQKGRQEFEWKGRCNIKNLEGTQSKIELLRCEEISIR